jgi:hypothetical protein
MGPSRRTIAMFALTFLAGRPTGQTLVVALSYSVLAACAPGTRS